MIHNFLGGISKEVECDETKVSYREEPNTKKLRNIGLLVHWFV